MMALNMVSSNEEEAPFLSDVEARSVSGDQEKVTRPGSLRQRVFARSTTSPKAFLILNVFLILLNLAWSTVNLNARSKSRFETSSRRPHGGLFEPKGAPMHLKNETWDMPIGSRSAFTDMDPAVADAAWATVNMGGQQGWFKASKSKVDEMGQDSIAFADGSGYLFGLDVFHQLHCLDFIRKKTIMYHHLYPYVEEDDDIPVAYHIAHCIDSIRLSLQCHADLTLIPQRWADGWIEPWAIWTNQHQCRDFDAVVGWARTNFPKLGSNLVHPKLGAFNLGHLNHSALPIWNEPHDELPEIPMK